MKTMEAGAYLPQMAPLYIFNSRPLNLAHGAAIPTLCHVVYCRKQNYPKAFVPCHKVSDNLSDIMFHTNSGFLTGLAHNDRHAA